MKRIRKFAALNIMAALIGAGIPALAAQQGYTGDNRGARQYQATDQRGNHESNTREDRDRRDHHPDYREHRSFSYSHAPADHRR